MGLFDDHQLDGELSVEHEKRAKKPRRFKVLLHNDDYTTTDFVVDILTRYFDKAHGEAVQIMLQVHHKGVGVAGVYPRDVAETKIFEVTAEARAKGMPLLLSKEPE
ncbi:MAG: ATP-dependent Clp protease adaptor ClpS [Holophagales bacterium]|nr:ATP-dependent Clp protease adaptor ClpS [Holophagales bacterium]